MENILSELFRAQISSSNNETLIISGQGFSGGNSTRGTYLPGFGVIFMVSNQVNNLYRLPSGSNSNSYSFYYDSDGDENLEIDQESITARIQEFLRDYGSTIGQLGKEDKVMVIYGSKSNSSRIYYRLATTIGSSSSDEEQETLPVISVSAKVSDLNDYRAGKLNSNNFNSRLAVATSEDKQYLDLKVMGNIFETALKDQNEESFRVMGGVSHLMLDNFGALFSLDVRYSDFPGTSSTALWEVRERMRPKMDNGRVVTGTATKDVDASDISEKIGAAYSGLVSNIKEYIVDYGRTLSSLGSDQFLLLSININGRYENIPGRLDIQVKKSVLEQLDKGSISRDQALQRVVVTEY
ncbi:MAG: hypothetical protein BalsKO_29970 [Balneolaceae bacterium]